MALLELLVIVLGFALFLFILTQIVLPMIFNMPLFPNFRKTTPLKVQVDAAEKELEEQTELTRLNEQLLEINRRKAQLEKK